jgi:hypothetical protein
VRLDQEPSPDNLRALFESIRKRHQSGQLSKAEIVVKLKKAAKANVTGHYLTERFLGKGHEEARKEALERGLKDFDKIQQLEDKS